MYYYTVVTPVLTCQWQSHIWQYTLLRVFFSLTINNLYFNTIFYGNAIFFVNKVSWTILIPVQSCIDSIETSVPQLHSLNKSLLNYILRLNRESNRLYTERTQIKNIHKKIHNFGRKTKDSKLLIENKKRRKEIQLRWSLSYLRINLYFI